MQVEQAIFSISDAHRGYTPVIKMATAVSKYDGMDAYGVWNKLGSLEVQMVALIVITTKSTWSLCQPLFTDGLTQTVCSGDCGGGGDGEGHGTTCVGTQYTNFKGGINVCNAKNFVVLQVTQ